MCPKIYTHEYYHCMSSASGLKKWSTYQPSHILRRKQTFYFFFKVFWSSGRPLLRFSRFWPSENVARIRRVYFAYSRTKSVYTRNIASNARGKCVFFFVLIAPNDRITSYIAWHWRPGQNFMMFQRTKNETCVARMATSKILCKRQKWGRSRPICIHIFALLVLNLV